MKPRALTDEEAAQLYAEYQAWLEARRTLHPKKLAAKYGIDRRTLATYVNRRHVRAA